MEIYIWIVVGAAVALIITEIIMYVSAANGTLRIDHSDPEKDIYRIEIDNLDKLSKKKRIILKVDNDADLSQE